MIQNTSATDTGLLHKLQDIQAMLASDGEKTQMCSVSLDHEAMKNALSVQNPTVHKICHRNMPLGRKKKK